MADEDAINAPDGHRQLTVLFWKGEMCLSTGGGVLKHRGEECLSTGGDVLKHMGG